ncbi:MAG: hypothetical protein HY789_00150 [Deltaproteobacteria bacterium]|nr:hypothetical protein [Deltaproteobacteria bacterium]
MGDWRVFMALLSDMPEMRYFCLFSEVSDAQSSSGNPAGKKTHHGVPAVPHLEQAEKRDGMVVIIADSTSRQAQKRWKKCQEDIKMGSDDESAVVGPESGFRLNTLPE